MSELTPILFVSTAPGKLLLILSRGTFERMQRQDPADFLLSDVEAKMGEVRMIAITYLGDDDMAEFLAMTGRGDFQAAIKLATRGHQFDPARGDGMAPIDLKKKADA